MACKHKWVHLSQTIRNGKIVGEISKCTACRAIRTIAEPEQPARADITSGEPT
jgi:hypothetical protein